MRGHPVTLGGALVQPVLQVADALPNFSELALLDLGKAVILRRNRQSASECQQRRDPGERGCAHAARV
jgi:hypothetical protein